MDTLAAMCAYLAASAMVIGIFKSMGGEETSAYYKLVVILLLWAILFQLRWQG